MDLKIHERLIAEADKIGILIHPTSLTKHPVQGYMSDVYTSTSSVGGLVIHLMRLNAAQEHALVSKKIKPVSDLLLETTDIPVAKIYLSIRIEPYTIFVSQLLPGSPAGKRDLIDSEWVDNWRIPLPQIQGKLETILSRIHSVYFSAFGWLGSDMSTGGTFSTWLDFLDEEVDFWADRIASVDYQLGNVDEDVASKLRLYFRSKRSALDYVDKPVLVHGDFTNPSNILLRDRHISGVIDWEFAIAADPAWEFAFQNRYSLETYFDLMHAHVPGMDEGAFRNRITLYGPLICGFWCFLNADKPTSFLYQLVRAQLIRKLSSSL